MMNIISLGAGVQSSTMALMAAHGELMPMPDCAIFADTGWEPKRVYDWLEKLVEYLPFPFYRVQRGNLRQEQIDGGSARAGRFAGMPWFIRNPDGSKGMGRRQCTSHYKVEVINRKVVELCQGRRKKGQAIMWVGISTDEAGRMKDSKVQYIKNRWPLIELGMSRHDCEKWLTRHGYLIPPKSACIGCPYHNDAMWRDMKKNDPESWNDAVEVDRLIRRATKHRGMKGEQFMHPSLIPLGEVDLSTDEDRGQLNLFNNECEGYCGV